MGMYASSTALYRQNQGTDKQQFVEDYAPLVKRIAWHLKSSLPPNIQVEDLLQAGMIGLLEAARNFDAGQGASFETYASIRIRGSMLDEIRKNDWAPRSVHRNARRVAEAVRYIENEKGRDARDNEIAEALDIELDEYYQILQDSNGHKLVSLEDLGVGEDDCARDILPCQDLPIIETLQREDTAKIIANAIVSLPEREQLILSLYYDEELNLREIGAVIGVSESRVSQIHSQALLRLQARLMDLRQNDSV